MKTKEKSNDMTNICGIIIGEANSAKDAKKIARIMQNCPNLVASGTTSNKIYSVYIVPEKKEWWLRYPEINPKATGLEKAAVYIVKNVSYPEEFAFRLPHKKTEIAPCGANCKTCPLRKEYNCSGCPATIHYQNTKRRQKR